MTIVHKGKLLSDFYPNKSQAASDQVVYVRTEPKWVSPTSIMQRAVVRSSWYMHVGVCGVRQQNRRQTSVVGYGSTRTMLLTSPGSPTLYIVLPLSIEHI